MKLQPFNIPSDGQPVFVIAGQRFKINLTKSNISTSASGKIYTELVAKLAKKSKKLPFLDEKNENGEVTISFSAKGIYAKNALAGHFMVEEGSTGKPLFLSCRYSGFDFGLEFYGHIEYKDGWIGFNGLFKKTYNEEPVFSVQIYYPIIMEELNFSEYEFTIAEALLFPKKEKVQDIYIDDPSIFPSEVFGFTQLKKLVLQGNYNFRNPIENYSIMDHIPDGLGDLQALTNLRIVNTCIKIIPESVGKLKLLEFVSFGNNKIKELPTALFQLPNIHNLSLSNNNLESLPAKINLPKLVSISLDKNSFKTLPESLAIQPLIENIDIKDNPLEKLPKAFNQVKEIALELRNKHRLLNFDYQGANSKGVIEWNNKLFFAENDPELAILFKEAIKSTVLEKHEKDLNTVALKAVCLQTTLPDDYSRNGNTRFGGLPDLPKGYKYPTLWNEHEETNSLYQFIAQLNLQDLARFQDYLPQEGMLYFFLEDQEDFKCKVQYHPNMELQSAKDLDIDEEMIYDEGGIYKPFKADSNKMIALPHFYFDDVWIIGTSLEALGSDGEDEYTYLKEEEDIRKKIGVKGVYRTYSDTYYPDDHHAINTYAFTQHEQPQEQATSKLKGKYQDWVILLKVHSDDNSGFCFWDAGEICFLIHKSDLAKRDFSNVFCTLETS